MNSKIQEQVFDTLDSYPINHVITSAESAAYELMMTGAISPNSPLEFKAAVDAVKYWRLVNE